MSNVQMTLDKINSLQPLDIVSDPAVRDRFIQIWDTLWGPGTGAAAYERESVYFNALLRDKEGGKLQKATPFSIFTAFIDLAVCGLSLEPGSRALCYLMGRNYNTGLKNAAGKDIYEGRCVLTVSAYGELVLRERAGQIRHADNPVLVYANDEFSFADRGGRKSVDYVCHYPHTGHPVVACFMRITRADGSVDYSVMFQDDWERLAAYSGRQNAKWINGQRVETPNALYTSGAQGGIDTGFLMAKCIKHAFRTYPKVRIGRGTELQSQQVETPEIEINDDLYGVDTTTGEVYDQPRNQPESFAPSQPQAAGITIETDPDADVF